MGIGELLLAMLGVLVIIAAGMAWVRTNLSLRRLEEQRVTLQRLEALLREQERVLHGEEEQTRRLLGRQVLLGQKAEQKAILTASGRLYQALERRFGELQKSLVTDAGDLRVRLSERFDALKEATERGLGEGRLAQERALAEVRETVEERLHRHRQALDERQSEALARQQEALRSGMEGVGRQVGDALNRYGEDMGRRVDGLTESTERRLQEISGRVDRRLSEGFEKTTETFTRVLEHLSRIDEAQKRITELSANVVSLQEVLTDKRSRGAFGEVQLHALVRNVMPEGSFSLQHTLSNGMRVDCLLNLPEPTGNVPIDAKFPLESYQHLVDPDATDSQRQQAATRFRLDIRKHLTDIAEKYLLPGETADGAVMFIPAEAIFAEIHARFPELVDEAQQRRVWMTSPTTLMAVLTTARAVLRDEATRQQVHIIQDHLRDLSRDFGRFQQRMDNLARHIAQAHRDAEQVNVSARKISGRFERIERVELEGPEQMPDPEAAPAAES